MSTRIVPILRVADAAASVEWYAQLGFERVFEHRFEEGLPAYVGISRDGAELHLSEHTGDAAGPALAYVWIDDLDALAERFGLVPDVMPWARDIEVTDPDGNRLRLAQAHD